MTFTDQEIIREILENDGIYLGDPQMALIYSYEHDIAEGPHFAVFTHEMYDDMYRTPYIKRYKLLWSRSEGLTSQGKAWLEAVRQ
jgi:hypothetical protein